MLTPKAKERQKKKVKSLVMLTPVLKAYKQRNRDEGRIHDPASLRAVQSLAARNHGAWTRLRIVHLFMPPFTITTDIPAPPQSCRISFWPVNLLSLLRQSSNQAAQHVLLV